MEKKYDLNDYLKYQKMLEEYSEGNRSELILNDSIVHAVLVYTQLLKKAMSEEKPYLNIYCGKLSIFRDSTKRKVEEEMKRIKPEDPSLLESWKNFQPYDSFIETLKDFFLKDGKMNVIIGEKDAPNFRDQELYDFINDKIKNSKLKIQQNKFSLGVHHFAYTGSSCRYENNDLLKTALCCFNDSAVNVYEQTFNFLENESIPFTID